MTDRPLWAPWRIEYITGPKEGDCIFCAAAVTTMPSKGAFSGQPAQGRVPLPWADLPGQNRTLTNLLAGEEFEAAEGEVEEHDAVHHQPDPGRQRHGQHQPPALQRRVDREVGGLAQQEGEGGGEDEGGRGDQGGQGRAGEDGGDAPGGAEAALDHVAQDKGGPGGEHYLTVAGEGAEISARAIEAVAAAHGISAATARNIVARTTEAVGGFARLAADYGVSKRTAAEVGVVLREQITRYSAPAFAAKPSASAKPRPRSRISE